MRVTLGLREKSVLALLGACAVVLLLASLIGWRAVESVRSHLGAAYARNLTLLKRERVLAPMGRELALSRRLAASPSIRQWMEDEDNPGKKALAFQEAESFRRDFADNSFFLAPARSNSFYFIGTRVAFSAAPRYTLKPDDPLDAWFFYTLKGEQPATINIETNATLGITKIWFNVIITEGGRRIGVVGTGLDLPTFLHDFIGTAEPGVKSMIVDVNGAIQAHPDPKRIAFNALTSAVPRDQTLFGLLQGRADEATARAALDAAVREPGRAELFSAIMDGKKKLLAVSYIPELKWHVLTAVNLASAKVIDTRAVMSGALAVAALFGVMVLSFAYAVNRLVLWPLVTLKQAAEAMAAGDYAVALPAARDDEIGALTAAFAAMARQVRHHTEELEDMVCERTRDLVVAHRDMASAHTKISDSIAYASLIQHAILPDRQVAAALGDNHFVLWRPRDVVGGDFYVYREAQGGCLLGVLDCAGHGVPGAFMTMLAYATIDQAIDEVGAADPAAVLARTDAAMRSMLQADTTQRPIATTMDGGLAYIDFAARRVVFAGARVALYWCDGEEVGVIKGARRSLGDRRAGQYSNKSVDLLGARGFYLTTDGFLDQAGGEKGFGFGERRFVAMLRRHARQPLAEQRDAFATTLADYQGGHPQRDDITVVCFRFA